MVKNVLLRNFVRAIFEEKFGYLLNIRNPKTKNTNIYIYIIYRWKAEQKKDLEILVLSSIKVACE